MDLLSPNYICCIYHDLWGLYGWQFMNHTPDYDSHDESLLSFIEAQVLCSIAESRENNDSKFEEKYSRYGCYKISKGYV